MPGVYDPEKEKTFTPHKPGDHDDLGVHPERREAEVDDLERQFAAPNADKESTSEAEQEEAAKLGDDADWDTNVEDDDDSGRGDKRFRVTGKQAAAGGGVAALLVSGGLGLFAVFGGPLEVIHLGQVLNKPTLQTNKSISRRLGSFVKYTPRAAKTGNLAENRVSRWGSKRFHDASARMAEKGIKINDVNGNMTTIELDAAKHPETKNDLANARERFAEIMGSELEGIKVGALDASGNIVPSTSGKNVSIDAVYYMDSPNSVNAQKMVVQQGLDAIGEKGVGGALSRRLMAKWLGLPSLFHPIKYVKKEAKLRLNDVLERTRKRVLERENARQDETKGKVRQAAIDANAKINEKLSPNAREALSKSLMVVGALCTVRSMANEVTAFNNDVVVTPSQVEATEKQALGSQLQSGVDVDIAQYGDVTKTFVDDDGQSIWQGKALNAMATDSAGKGEEIRDGYKQAFMPTSFNSVVDTAVNNVGADALCHPASQFLQMAVGGVLLVTSGGTSSILSRVGNEGVQMVVMTAVIGMLQGVINDTFGQDAIKQFSGAQGGNLMAYGARSASNLISMSMGGIALKNSNNRIAEAKYEREYRQEFQQKSFATRMFDVTDSRSLAGSLSMSFSASSLSNGRAILSGLSPSSVFRHLGSIMSPRASAAEEEYDWGFPVYGIPSSIQEDPKYEDPYQNADIATGIFNDDALCGGITRCKDKAKTCFGVSISKVGGMWAAQASKPVNPNEEGVIDANCDDTSNENWIRTFLFVFDNAIVTQVDCWEGSDSSCAEFGMGGASTSNTSESSGISGIELPPNLGPEVGNGYYLMPEAPNGEYVFSTNNVAKHYGSKELIGAIYTVAKKWHEKYPNSRLRIGDLNSRGGHLSHSTGVDVDITTEDRSAAQVGGNAEMSKELGRMFADTGIIKLIYYNDSAVQNDVNSYAESKGVTANMQSWTGHEDHFHVRVKDEYKLQAGGQP